MRKPARKQIICSPRPHLSKACPSNSQAQSQSQSQSLPACHNDDIWIAISQFLDARSVVNLSLTNRRFYALTMDNSIWKAICLRDLQVPPPRETLQFSWKDLYAASFDGSHSYSFRQVEKHIDWMRIGAFFVESGEVLVTDKLTISEAASSCLSSFTLKEKRNLILPAGAYLLSNVKTGIWIADLQLVRCPVCNLKTCEGTMQSLDVRHFELFLHKQYKQGSWDYVEVASHVIHTNCCAATAGIIDATHISTHSTLELLDLKSWTGKPGEWEPKVKISSHATAVSTNLQDNEGLHVRYHVMKSEEGAVMAIRVSQQLV